MRELAVAEHFSTAEQQGDAARLGMWIFLASEILLFTGMFTLYAGGRAHYPGAFAVGIDHNLRWLGSLNTVILIVSSYLVARGVHEMRSRRSAATARFLLGTMALGLAFLVLKAVEYGVHMGEGAVPGGGTAFYLEHSPGKTAWAVDALPFFFGLYYLMTGAHALHVIVGLGVLGWLFFEVRRVSPSPLLEVRVELGALYWHLVDVIWIFLWPLFYLTGGGTA